MTPAEIEAAAQLETAKNSHDWLDAHKPGRTNQHRAVRAERNRAVYRARRAGASNDDVAEHLGISPAKADDLFWAGHRLIVNERTAV